MTEASQVKTKQIIDENREEIKRIALEHGAFHVRLFGSVVREEDQAANERHRCQTQRSLDHLVGGPFVLS